MINLFSESVNFQVSDIHLILGPSTDHMSSPGVFADDPKSTFYDLEDQITNIAMMHEVLEERRKPERMMASKQRQAAKVERRLDR